MYVLRKFAFFVLFAFKNTFSNHNYLIPLQSICKPKSMTKHILCISIFLFSCVLSASAQQTVSAINVFEQLAQRDSVSGAEITFHQDSRIEQLFIDRRLIGAGETWWVGVLCGVIFVSGIFFLKRNANDAKNANFIDNQQNEKIT